MDAHEVNIKIAKALGYDWKRDGDAVQMNNAEGYTAFRVYTTMSDDDIWDYVINEGLIPNWSTDIAAAIELVSGVKWHATYAPEPSQLWGTHFEVTARFDVGIVAGRGETLPFAICEAWLAADSESKRLQAMGHST